MMEFSIESDSSNNFAGAGRGAGRSNVNNSNQAQAQAVQSPYRPLYLMVFRSALFKAHWSFWAPALDDGAQKVGQRVHVTGNVRNGFQLEFVRNYDLTETSGYPTIIEIGAMRTEILQDTPLDRREFREDTPRDRFEFIAQSIPAPSGSLNKVNEQPRIAIATESANRNAGLTGSSGSTVGQGDRTPAPRRVNVQDCQFWIKQVVDSLVASGDLIPPQRGANAGRDPREILATSPMH